MCRWLAYSGQPVYLEDLVCKPEHSLVQQSRDAQQAKCRTNGDGFGIGWYDSRPNPGLYREVLPAWNDPNLRSLASQIRAPLFFAHVRASTGTESIRPNCHPFAQGRWLFMHNGQIGGYERLRRRLEALIPDAVYAGRQGTTDSELLFLLLFLHGLEEDPAKALAAMLAQVAELTAEAGITEPLRFTAALSDGESLHAIRHASDNEAPTLYWRVTGEAVTLVSEPLDEVEEDWQAMPLDRLLTVGPNRAVSFQDLPQVGAAQVAA